MALSQCTSTPHPLIQLPFAPEATDTRSLKSCPRTGFRLEPAKIYPKWSDSTAVFYLSPRD